MVTINGETNLFLSILCMSLCFVRFLIPTVIAFAHSIRSRIRFAKQIQQNQANGFYDAWSKPPLSNRLRILGLLGLVSILGVMGWFVTGFINPSTMFSSESLIIFGLLSVVGMVVGTILQRMVTKGK